MFTFYVAFLIIILHLFRKKMSEANISSVGYGEASEKGQGEAVVPGKAALLSSAQGQNMDKQNGSKANIQTPTQENHSRNGTPKSLLSPSRRKSSSMPWLDGGPARLRSVTLSYLVCWTTWLPQMYLLCSSARIRFPMHPPACCFSWKSISI